MKELVNYMITSGILRVFDELKSDLFIVKNEATKHLIVARMRELDKDYRKFEEQGLVIPKEYEKYGKK